MKRNIMCAANADKIIYRSKEYLFFLYLGMLAVTSRSGLLQRKLLLTSTMFCGMILRQ